MFVFFIVAANALPDDNNYQSAVEPDWQLVPDGNGLMHIVDVNNLAVEPFFNAWTDVIIRLVTRNNRNNPLPIQLNNAGLLHSSPFNPSHQTRFLIHGWMDNGNADMANLLRNAYLDRGNFNVFIVDWGAGAITINYPAARNRINDVGHYVAQYIDFLHRERGTPFPSITVVGHSLGAHTAGIAGKRVSRGRIQNIVSLDPAFPLFSFGNTTNRVHFNDAHFVESIHTDAGRVGFDEPLGDATFYPNWGRNMPGCGADLTGSCGHGRAWEYFGESIRTGNFWATRCFSYSNILSRNCTPAGPNQLMGGEPVFRAANGVYYIETNAFPPFVPVRR